MKNILILIILLSPIVAAKNIQNCGKVEIEQVITGPRHGALLNLSSNDCGNSGYVCIDIEGLYTSKEKGQAAYAFALASKMAAKSVHVSVDLDYKPASCGNYPVVEDIRSN